MPIRLPAQFNQLNAPAIENARQQSEWNALRQEDAQREFSEDERLDNTRALAGMGKFGMDLMDKDPQSYAQFMPEIFKEFERRGMPTPQFDYTTASPEQVYEGLEEMHRLGMLGLAGEQRFEDVSAEDIPAGQRDPFSGKITAVGASQRRPSAPIQNYAERQALVAKHGEGSQQVKTFDNYVRSQKVVDIAQVPTSIGAGGTTPLSDLSAETSAATEMKAAEAEGTASVIPAGDRIDVYAKYPRMQAARRNIDGLRAAHDQVMQNANFQGGPLQGGALSLTAPGQSFQRYADELMAHIQALIRVKGIGAQSDWEGRLQQAPLPGLNMHPEVREQAFASYESLLNDLEAALQNVASGDTSKLTTEEATEDVTPTGRTATNPDTGERLQQMSDGSWQPM